MVHSLLCLFNLYLFIYLFSRGLILYFLHIIKFIFLCSCGFACWGSNHLVTFIFGLIIIIIGICYMLLHFSPLERPGPLIGPSEGKKSEGSDNQKQEQGQSQNEQNQQNQQNSQSSDQQSSDQQKESSDEEPTASSA